MRTDQWGTAAAALVTVAFLGLAAVGILVRAPWLDEFLVRYFVASPSELLTLNRGTGHPLGWYLPFLPAAHLVGDGMPWLRTVGLLAVPVATSLACWPLVQDRRGWARTLLVTGPAAAGTVIVLERGIDARPYGALTIASLIVGATLWERTDHSPLDLQAVWSVAAALTLLAVTHLTGLVLAVGFAVAAGRLGLVARRGATAPVLAACITTTAAWWWGVQDVAAASSTLEFSPDAYLGWIVDGISGSRPLSAILLAMWLASLLQGDRRSVWFYDAPAVLTLVTLGLVSTLTPVAKPYTLMPALVLLLAGTIVRLSTMRPQLHLAAILVLAVNFAVHAPRLLDDFFYWGETAKFVEAHADEIVCPVWAHPVVVGRLPADDMIDAVEVVPFGDDAEACACGDRWFVINHMTEDLPPPKLSETAAILEAWPSAAVGRVECTD